VLRCSQGFTPLYEAKGSLLRTRQCTCSKSLESCPHPHTHSSTAICISLRSSNWHFARSLQDWFIMHLTAGGNLYPSLKCSHNEQYANTTPFTVKFILAIFKLSVFREEERETITNFLMLFMKVTLFILWIIWNTITHFLGKMQRCGMLAQVVLTVRLWARVLRRFYVVFIEL
jgi:hypothetical protein